MGKDDLSNYLNENKDASEGEPIDWEKEREDFLAQLRSLNNYIRSWLSDFVDSKKAVIEDITVELSEDYIGSYTAPGLCITIGRKEITAMPMGTLLVGARGRVDMKCEGRLARIVLVPETATGNALRAFSQVDDDSSESKKVVLSEWVWKLTTAPPKIKYIDLNEDVFADVVLGLING